MLRPKTIIFLLLSSSMFSQVISGKIYDHEETVKGAKIFNTSRKSFTYTNEKGEFTMDASINDTLVFSSYFHKEQTLAVTNNHFNGILIIELKKAINRLDEVRLTNEPKQKEFSPEVYSKAFGLQIKNDIKLNPHLYQPAPSGNGIDFIKLAGLIGKLFKSEKPKESPIIATSYKQYDSLFSNDPFLNNKLLSNDLNIPKSYKNLFFNYCGAKNLNEKLLLKENRFILLDSLVKFSNEFLKVIDEYENSK